jgi:hypothetical protein
MYALDAPHATIDSLAILWTAKSSNKKTGKIPVTTSAKSSCAIDCVFKGNGCYAESGPLGFLWSQMSDAGPNAPFVNGVTKGKTTDWTGLCVNVSALPKNQLWRHNQAGDLPHNGGKIDAALLSDLVSANTGKRGFTYTHHNIAQDLDNRRAVANANAAGFTINASANNPAHADILSDLDVAPVVVVLPASVQGKQDLATPKGRKIVVCPATYRDDVSCKTCGLCAVRDRNVIVGFPAHGARKRKASELAS